MAGGLRGADLERLDQLSGLLGLKSDQLARLTTAASGQIAATARLWDGPDANGFRNQWTGNYRPRLLLAARSLQDAAETITRNRNAQEDTSAVSAFSNPDSPLSQDPPRPTPQEILDGYQVEDDELVEWKPKLGGLPWFRAFWTDPILITQTEADLLDRLASERGLVGLDNFRDIRDQAFEESGNRFAPTQRIFDGTPITANFDHNDAYRHTYWSALLTAEFGPEFAKAFTDAHEGVPGNPADMEAMDLHNNELGIQIAEENPDASTEELADLVEEAVVNGDAVVIDAGGELAYSDDEAVGDTGVADDLPLPGDAPDEWDPES